MPGQLHLTVYSMLQELFDGCRHLGNAGEAAVHLLSRLLAFDPTRRCPAEEALSHEYLANFENLDANMGTYR